MQEKNDAVDIQVQNIAKPVQVQERIEILDVIRGFALLGILIFNIAAFSGPAGIYEAMGKGFWGGVKGFWDTRTVSFINFLIQGKFYTMFSLLFGLGFFIFLERAKEKVARPKWLFYKRILILLLIGLLHIFFIWHGDVLVSYALVGLLLPLFFNLKPKNLLIWAGSIFFVLVASLTLVLGGFSLSDENMRAEMLKSTTADLQYLIDASFLAYGSGTFAEIQAQRTSDAIRALGNVFANFFAALPLFLIGLYIGKKGVFQNIDENLPLIKKVWIWGLAMGLPLSVVKLIATNLMTGAPFSFFRVIHIGVGFFANLGIALFLMASLVLLWRKRSWLLRLKPLSYMGRMALSNYLLQSIICVLIFYNFGLGLYGQMGPALLFVLAIVIFIAQIFISKYWMKRYEFGPVEWLWKSLTYGKFFRMKKDASR